MSLGRRTRRSFAVAALLSLGAGTARAQATVNGFDGVWQPIDPPAALRTIEGKDPPLLPAARSLYAQRKAQLAKGDVSFDPTRNKCAPPGIPRIYTEAKPFEIITTSKQVFFGYQWNRLIRFVDLDAPMHVLSPFFFGNSVGHLDAGRLHIEADGFNDRTFLDRAGLPHSDQLKLTEDYSLSADGGRMTVRIRVEDPATFARPWETQLAFKRMPGARILEDICSLREHMVPKELQFFDAKP
jgi:hypothetical protein